MPAKRNAPNKKPVAGRGSKQRGQSESSTRKSTSSLPRRRVLKLADIRIDGDTQPREELNEDVVDEYRQAYEAGKPLPPLDVVFDGSNNWLTDGFHRRFSAEKAGLTKLPCIVTPGTREEAQWASYAANQAHGLRRSNDDKRRAVLAALRHPKGKTISDNLIAEHVGVNQTTVSKYRNQLMENINCRPDAKTDQVVDFSTCPPGADADPVSSFDRSSETPDPPTRTGRDGKQYPATVPQEEAAPPVPDDDEIPSDIDGTLRDEMKEWNRQLDQFIRRIPKADELPEGPWGATPGKPEDYRVQIGYEMRKLINTIRTYKGRDVCPKCKGMGCKFCRQVGWLNSSDLRDVGRLRQ